MLFNIVNWFNDKLFDIRYIKYNTFDKLYSEVKSGKIIYVRDRVDTCYKFCRYYNKIGVWISDSYNFIFDGVIISEDAANNDILTYQTLAGHLQNIDVKRISLVEEECCIVSKAVEDNLKEVMKFFGLPKTFDARTVFEKLVTRTISDYIDLFQVDTEGVHIIPGFVTEKFGEFKYHSINHKERPHIYDWYINSYITTIAAVHGRTTPFIDAISKVVDEHYL